MITENHKEIFKDFCNLLKNNNIEHFLIAGSLLGAWRDKSPIKTDSDFDIGVYDEDYEKVKKLINDSDIFHIYHLWRKEITVLKKGFKKSESQIDIFFIERDNNGSYLYSCKSNPFSKIWDVEWRMKFNPGVFDTLIDCNNFLPKFTIKIPKNTEEILKMEYGADWKKHNPDWNTYNAPAYDKDYRQIAIFIPTFLRDNCLKKLVKSIQDILPPEWYRLYIADQGIYTQEKWEWFEYLNQLGHCCYFLPFNSGLSISRNSMIDKLKEPFSLIVDDDFEITEETRLQDFLEVLHDKNIGIVGGHLKKHSDYHYRLLFQKNKLYYVQLKPLQYNYTPVTRIKEPVQYLYCDIVLNFSLIKKEVFDDIRWDDELKLVEHTDFYLRLKKLNKWKVAFVPSVKAEHQNKTNSSQYLSFRQIINTKESLNLFSKKWNIQEKDIIYIKEE
jgi:hypothetical protein